MEGFEGYGGGGGKGEVNGVLSRYWRDGGRVYT